MQMRGPIVFSYSIRIYLYITEEITKANISNDVSLLDNAISAVKPLSEAWIELAAIKGKEVKRVESGGRQLDVRPTVAFQATF